MVRALLCAVIFGEAFAFGFLVLHSAGADLYLARAVAASMKPDRLQQGTAGVAGALIPPAAAASPATPEGAKPKPAPKPAEAVRRPGPGRHLAAKAPPAPPPTVIAESTPAAEQTPAIVDAPTPDVQTPSIAVAAPERAIARPVVVAMPKPPVDPAPTVIALREPAVEPTPAVIATPKPAVDQAPTIIATPKPAVDPTPAVIANPEPAAAPTPTIIATPRPAVDPRRIVIATPKPAVDQPSAVSASETPVVAKRPVVAMLQPRVETLATLIAQPPNDAPPNDAPPNDAPPNDAPPPAPVFAAPVSPAPVSPASVSSAPVATAPIAPVSSVTTPDTVRTAGARPPAVSPPARQQTEFMADAIPVLTAAATSKDVPIMLDGLGTVQASALVTVRPQIDGTLLELNFREGQDVHVGDVLAKIDPRSYQAALDQAMARKRQDQANLANARLDAARYQKLAANQYASAQQADTARAAVAQMAAQVEQDQAQIDTAKVQLGYTTVTAPIDGRLGIRQVDAGNVVHATDTAGLVTITTLKPIFVVFTLPQQALPQVARAMRDGAPQVLALAPAGEASGSAGDDQVLDTGTLTVVDNQVDPATGTIKLKATFPNTDTQLWPGAFLNVRLRVSTIRDAVTVPPSAILRGPAGASVFVIGDDSRAHRREIKVGHEEADAAIVQAGLQKGEQVVTDGASRLTDNSPVTVAAPPEARRAGKS